MTQIQELDRVIGSSVAPSAETITQPIRWVGVVGHVDYSCPSGPGEIKRKGIGRSANGLVVAGQLPDDAPRTLPCYWEQGGIEAILSAIG